MILVSHRLVAAFKINDAQPPESQPKLFFQEITGRVRPAMNYGLRHASQHLFFGGAAAAQIQITGKTTHMTLSCLNVCLSVGWSLLIQFFDECVDCRSDAVVDGFSRKRSAEFVQVVQASKNRFFVGKKIYEARQLIHANFS